MAETSGASDVAPGGDAAPGAPPAASAAQPPASDTAGRTVGMYRLGEQVGAGSFATVWKAVHVETGEEVAVKQINLKRLNRKLRESLESEIAILQHTRHANIIRLHDIIKEPEQTYLVLELCTGGDLSQYIRKRRRVPEGEARRLARQLCGGLRALRQANLVHRDLKPQNLLLDGEGDDLRLIIADFGFARYVSPHGMAETLCGSPLYMAPEILRFQKYDAKADLWSVGAVLFELVVGRTPYTGQNHVQLLRNIEAQDVKLPQSLGLSKECQQVLLGLLQRQPVERMSHEALFSHAFVAEPGAHDAVQRVPFLGGGNSGRSSRPGWHQIWLLRFKPS